MKTFLATLTCLGSIFSLYFVVDAILGMNQFDRIVSAILAIAFTLIPFCLYMVFATKPGKED